jgi:hypothetical protein
MFGPHPDDEGPMATMADAHREWHLNTGVPMGQPGCPQDACHPPDDYDEVVEDFDRGGRLYTDADRFILLRAAADSPEFTTIDEDDEPYLITQGDEATAVISVTDSGFHVEAYVYVPGSFSPVDGGSPPDTDEVPILDTTDPVAAVKAARTAATQGPRAALGIEEP